MKTITHREMRNNSSEILRKAKAGESFEVTNNGEVVANIIPPRPNPYPGVNVQLAKEPFDFSKIKRVKIDLSSQELLDMIREERL